MNHHKNLINAMSGLFWWFADKFTWVLVTIVSHMSTWHLVRESTLDVTMSTLFFSIFHLTFAVSDGIDERNPAPIILHIVNILQFTSICRVIVSDILWTGEWCRTSTSGIHASRNCATVLPKHESIHLTSQVLIETGAQYVGRPADGAAMRPEVWGNFGWEMHIIRSSPLPVTVTNEGW